MLLSKILRFYDKVFGPFWNYFCSLQKRNMFVCSFHEKHESNFTQEDNLLLLMPFAE